MSGLRANDLCAAISYICTYILLLTETEETL